MIDETVAKGAKVIVFPELCVTGYTCSDLFTQDILLKKSKEALFKIAEYTKEKDAIIFIGVPLAIDGELYNVAAALNHGEILGLTTKTFLPNYGEFYEMRQFRPGPDKARWITLDGKQIPFGPQLLFEQFGVVGDQRVRGAAEGQSADPAGRWRSRWCCCRLPALQVPEGNRRGPVQSQRHEPGFRPATERKPR